jgi:putative sporulation protein YyaC
VWNPFSRAMEEKSKCRVHVDDSQAWYRMGEYLRRNISEMQSASDIRPGLIVLCIGTDRSTGDCLGPLTGSLLGQDCRSGIDIMGTLNEPVHATNLKEAIAEIERLDRRPLVIAVDACLGRSENVGYINVCRGPLKPGTGVNKVLPEVGDMHITGIVNVGGYMEYLVLQNTRLSLVMRMATSIAKAIQYAAGLDGPSVQAEGLREQTSPLLARQESAVADGTPPSAVGPHL